MFDIAIEICPAIVEAYYLKSKKYLIFKVLRLKN